MTAQSIESNLTPATNVRWRIVTILMVYSFFAHYMRQLVPVAGDSIREDYGLSDTQLGLVSSVMLWTYAILMTPGGWLVDHLGGKKCLILMGFGTAFATFATGAFSQVALAAGIGLPVLLITRSLVGVFSPPMYPAAGRIVKHWLPFQRRAFATGVITAASQFGVAFAFLFFTWFVSRVGWRPAFMWSGAAIALVATIWSWYAREYPRQHPHVNEAEARIIESQESLARDSESRECVSNGGESAPDGATSPLGVAGTWRHALANRSVWLLTLSYACVGYVEYMIAYWSKGYFEGTLKFSKEEASFYLMLPPFAMAAGMPIGGWLSDRLVTIWRYRAARACVGAGGMSLCALVLFTGTFVSSPFLAVTLIALSQFAIGICEGSAWATAIDLGGASGGRSAAIVNTGGNGGGSIAPVMTPYIVALLLREGVDADLAARWSLRVGCLICLLGASLWLGIDAGERASSDEPPAE